MAGAGEHLDAITRDSSCASPRQTLPVADSLARDGAGPRWERVRRIFKTTADRFSDRLR